MNRTFGLVLQNPVATMQASLAHYLNSQVQSFLILPTAFRSPESLVTWIGHRSAGQLWEDCCGLVAYPSLALLATMGWAIPCRVAGYFGA
jgi:hypothetical protein